MINSFHIFFVRLSNPELIGSMLGIFEKNWLTLINLNSHEHIPVSLTPMHLVRNKHMNEESVVSQILDIIQLCHSQNIFNVMKEFSSI